MESSVGAELCAGAARRQLSKLAWRDWPLGSVKHPREAVPELRGGKAVLRVPVHRPVDQLAKRVGNACVRYAPAKDGAQREHIGASVHRFSPSSFGRAILLD